MNTAEQNDIGLPGLRHLEIVSVPLGLLGFERVKEYQWIENSEEAPFSWLQARRDAGLMFLVVPLFEVVAEYEPSISDEDVEFLGLSSPRDALIYGIVTLRPQGRATVNLKGPVVVNRFTRLAKQAVLTNASEYPLQYPLPVAG